MKNNNFMIDKAFIPTVYSDQTVGFALTKIRDKIENWETINYLYIVDKVGKLLGVVSIKELFKTSNTKKVSDIMTTKITHVKPDVTPGKMVYKALKSKIKMVPVLDSKHILLGVINSRKILTILYREMRDDLLRLAGIYDPSPSFDKVLEVPILTSLKHRIPWLLLGLMGGIFTSKVIGFFDLTLKNNLIIASFIPLMTYMSGAVVTQMEAFIVRDMSLSSRFYFGKYFVRQFAITFLVALICSIALSVFVLVFYKEALLIPVMGISIFFAIISAVFTGLLLPYLFGKLKIDPAIASGPLAAIAQDVLSVSIFFVIASYLLS